MYEEVISKLKKLQALFEVCDDSDCANCKVSKECLELKNDELGAVMKQAVDALTECDQEREALNEAATALHGALGKWYSVQDKKPSDDEIVASVSVGGGEWYYRVELGNFAYSKMLNREVRYWMPLPEVEAVPRRSVSGVWL